MAALGLAFAAPAWASPEITIVCDAAEAGEIARTLALELPGLGDAAETSRIEVRCSATVIDLYVGTTTGRAERRIDVTGSARARLAALIATEMLATLLLAPATTTPELPPQSLPIAIVPPTPEPELAPVAAPVPTPASWRGAAAASARAFRTNAWQAVGLAAVVERDLWPHAAAAADLRVEAGEVAFGTGSANVVLVSLGVGPALRLGTRASSLSVGAGLRAGIASFGANAPPGGQGRRSTEAWLGPEASIRAWFALGPTLLSLSLEGGVVALPARTHDLSGAETSLDGPWLAATLGLGGQL